jgi:hypothetical protein
LSKLSITRKLRSDHQTGFDIGETGYASPHHHVAWRSVMGTGKIATKAGKLGGYKVLTAASARQGLTIAAACAVVAVVVDYHLPEMNGHEVAIEIKRLKPSSHKYR